MTAPENSKKRFVIGLTGKMCAGKNAAADWLARAGFAVIDADQTAHQALDECRGEVSAAFSAEAEACGIRFRNADGSINRRELGRLLFRYPDLLERHERILFPRINALLKAFIRENAGRHVVINAPLLFKSEAAALCDFVLLITAPAVIRFWRAKKRDGLPFRQIWQRFSAQKALFNQNISANTDIVRVGNGAGKRSLEKKLKAALRRKGIEAEYPEN